ncbi:hypothetical protein [Spirochaeta africana]|uniref:DUF1640 domain-containing protein n=1 Tax=Spirochaeta africana (strain ATCC 700263 / DSM 8902 / Z-7692) TaxID=889378 RepID=H9ULI9_SPIAZ|nr:hypothetical protein [Spirochaeta africana]AFG38382.1 hypothetical protein Spiaf_2350 [Spirochaeta africana DSM 8902]
MGNAAMNIGEQELQVIGEYVRAHLSEWTLQSGAGPYAGLDRALIERIVRVEEGLKALHDQMDLRFEQVDKRFEEMLHYMDKRFEAFDKRFVILQWVMGLGFTAIAGLMTLFNYF